VLILLFVRVTRSVAVAALVDDNVLVGVKVVLEYVRVSVVGGPPKNKAAYPAFNIPLGLP
jgi:hypothetical protein